MFPAICNRPLFPTLRDKSQEKLHRVTPAIELDYNFCNDNYDLSEIIATCHMPAATYNKLFFPALQDNKFEAVIILYTFSRGLIYRLIAFIACFHGFSSFTAKCGFSLVLLVTIIPAAEWLHAKTF